MKPTKKAPTNTTQQVRDNPLGIFLPAMADGMGPTIQNQEAQGQKSLVNSDTLPTDMRSGAEKVLKAAGVRFLEPVTTDPIFRYVELPAGWKKVPTDHSMWSNLVDQRGSVRAKIFYKAAFYDRSAHIYPEGRYSVQRDFDRQERENVAVCNVMDGEVVIHSTNPVKLPTERNSEYYQLTDSVDHQARAWLTEHYPKWMDASAYWD